MCSKATSGWTRSIHVDIVPPMAVMVPVKSRASMRNADGQICRGDGFEMCFGATGGWTKGESYDYYLWIWKDEVLAYIFRLQDELVMACRFRSGH